MSMSIFTTSFKVWAIAVFLNAFFFGVIMVLWGDFWYLGWAFVALLIGYSAGIIFWLIRKI
jgi:hypothetical protein